MSFPNYFTDEGGSIYSFSIGDRIYGSLTVNVDPSLSDSVVTYRFNDGQRPYTSSCSCNTEKQAIRFASKFAALMRRCDERNSLPGMELFENMALDFGTIC